ncbi:MAG: DUF1559 domain-containing protein [Thermoguttaceae bacterium]
MDRAKRRRAGLTMIEVLILIGIMICLGTMLFPAIQAARETARRTTCQKNLRVIATACWRYHEASNALIASSGVTREKNGKILAVDGWSWAALLLPYMENTAAAGGRDWKRLYDSLDIAHGTPLKEPAGARGTPHADALATRLPMLLCPSSGCEPYSDVDGRRAAISNYRPLGATHIESLSVASAMPSAPKYCPSNESRAYHPDGACCPGINLRLDSIRKGTSNTLAFTESVEPRFSRWAVGADAAVVGLPPNVEFELDDRYYLPKGHAQALKKSPEADATYWSYHTYLDWDYERCPYQSIEAATSGRFGPSSNHPGVTHHLFLDGSCCPLSNDIDVGIYMHLIQRRTF